MEVKDSYRLDWDSLPHSWDSDPRNPLFSVQVGAETWGLYAMSVPLWTEILGFLVVEAMLVALISTIVYHFVVKKQGTAFAYLICYGVFFPFWCFAPFYLFSALKLRHMMVRFTLGAVTPIIAMFRTTAAAHGFTPNHAKRSMNDFALHFATILTPLQDPKLDKFVPITPDYLLGHLKFFFIMVIVTGMIQSLFLLVPDLIPEMGQGALPPDSDWYNPSLLIQPRIWLRNILIAFLYQSYLTCFGEGLILAQCMVTGFQTEPIMDNPCLKARSFSDFWGRRWNLVIHEVLKTGVYLPVRKYCPKYVAMLASFIMSGLFHEWLLVVFTFAFDDYHGCLSNPDAALTSVHCYKPIFGGTSLFFVWQSILMALELSPLGRLSVWKYLPDPVAILLILISGGCTSHWFTEPYINSRFFLDAQILLFMFKPVTTS